jgi:hypothetical protein
MDFLVDRFLGMNNQDISDNKKAKEEAAEKKKEAEGATGGAEGETPTEDEAPAEGATGEAPAEGEEEFTL